MAAIQWEYTFFTQQCYRKAQEDFTAELKMKTGREAFKMKVATMCEKEPPESLGLEEPVKDMLNAATIHAKMERSCAGVVERIRHERATEKKAKEDSEAAEKSKREEVLRRRPYIMLEEVVTTLARKTYDEIKNENKEEPVKMDTDDSSTLEIPSPMEKTTELADALTKNGRGPAARPGADKNKEKKKSEKPPKKKQQQQQQPHTKKGG